MSTLEIRRRLSETVLSRLRPEIPDISAHFGEDYEHSLEPEAQTYRKIGGKFMWLAFGFAPWRFWDLHVGVVEVEQFKLSLGFHISERASTVLMPELEKLGSSIGASVIHQKLAVEYQANFSPLEAKDENFDEIVERITALCRQFAPVAKRFNAL